MICGVLFDLGGTLHTVSSPEGRDVRFARLLLERLADYGITLDAEPEELAKAQEVARTLLADAENWDRRVREYAAGELTSLANDWAEGEEELTPEDFMARMELSAIQVEPDGEFEFWFEDGEMFYGHSIHVMGNLTDGPDWAQMEG